MDRAEDSATEDVVPIVTRMTRWRIGDSVEVADLIDQMSSRDLSDGERKQVQRWVPTMRYLTWEPNKKYPYYHDPKTMAEAAKEIDRIELDLSCSLEETRNLRLSHALDTDYQPPVPAGKTLYPFQRAGVEYCLGKSRVLIADEMGLGKTAQAIVALNAHPGPGRILVVCPSTLRLNWLREFQAWSTRDYRYHVVTTKDRKLPPDTDVVICSYDLVWRRDFLGEFSTAILDEAHRIKNKTSKRSRAALHYLASTSTAYFVSGSPITKDVTDLHVLVQQMIPDVGQVFFKNFVVTTTEEVYVRGGRGKTRTVQHHKGKNQAELSRIIRSRCMLRRLKKDALPQLPPKTLQVIELPDISCVTPENVVKRVTDMLAVGRRPVETDMEDEHVATIRREQATAKAPHVVDHVVELLKEDETRKIVVFAYHKDVVKILTDGLAAYGCVAVSGSTPPDLRQKYIDAFQTTRDIRVFVGNMVAAGEGITLHAAALAVFAEPDWTWATIDQAENRIHRIGQEAENVLIQHVIVRGSIDEIIVKVMLGKKREAEAVLGNDD